MPDEALQKLDRINSGPEVQPTEAAKKINEAKRQLRYICQHLLHKSDQYKPELTVKSIESYIKANSICGRILYSELSSFIVGLDEADRATASANIDGLLSYTLNNNEVSDDVKKICVKLYDHFQLNLIQIVNAEKESDKAIAKSITDEKVKLHQEVKEIQKEYITILGIFAAIMLAFVGSFTFSTSVLNNIGSVSTGELIIIALVIGLVFVILLTVLIDFLLEINGRLRKEDGKARINSTGKCAVILIVTLLIGFLIGYKLPGPGNNPIQELSGKGTGSFDILHPSESSEVGEKNYLATGGITETEELQQGTVKE